jgi:hypothetical protein
MYHARCMSVFTARRLRRLNAIIRCRSHRRTLNRLLREPGMNQPAAYGVYFMQSRIPAVILPHEDDIPVSHWIKL